MTDPFLLFLQTLLDDAANGLAKVKPKRMFGCYCLFANDQIFAAVWKEGRINLKIPDTPLYGELLNTDGAKPWTVGKKVMSHWILVPEVFHDDTGDLRTWTVKAHQLALKATSSAKAKARQKAKPSTGSKANRKTRR